MVDLDHTKFDPEHNQRAQHNDPEKQPLQVHPLWISHNQASGGATPTGPSSLPDDAPIRTTASAIELPGDSLTLGSGDDKRRKYAGAEPEQMRLPRHPAGDWRNPTQHHAPKQHSDHNGNGDTSQ